MIEEYEGRWLIGLRGSTVSAFSRASDGQGLTVVFADEVVLEISGPVLLTYGPVTAPDAVVLTDENVPDLVGATARSVVVFTSGSLRVVFSTGHHLNVRGADSGVTVRMEKPDVFHWSSRQGIGTMKTFRSQDSTR
ncbi:DUF6188 family protein [Streptomyces sp. MB09-01]|uniref:DUF6188 family protein n=1 Tax=Streptomyces sp. MB09-01 TaxID=3028666 RepID=UPI0029ACE6E7|nr:DUF6188 family protein [Streptomyces sp. MB09-01]MDX3535462.1 DUF6188 family protein [Streptomyces sp. MB09-01]